MPDWNERDTLLHNFRTGEIIPTTEPRAVAQTSPKVLAKTRLIFASSQDPDLGSNSPLRSLTGSPTTDTPGRYKSLIVDGSGSGYLKSVGDYVHLNPARAKLVAADVPLKSFAWSSWPAYLLARSKRPSWVRVDRLLGEWGMPEDSPAGRQRLERALEERRGAEEGEKFKPIRRGWCLGEETFREELLAQMSQRMGVEHYGEERAETAEALAELIIAEELKLGRWQKVDFKTRPKGDSVKVALAARLRVETTMTAGWIAEHLAMGTRGYLNHLFSCIAGGS